MTEEQDLETWGQWYPDEKIPGSAEPLPGKCGGKARDKRLRELGITRYCIKTAGMGTDHLGEGKCKWHFGNTESHEKAATLAIVKKELTGIAASLGEPEPMGHPEIEAWRLANKMKQWSLILEEQMGQLNLLHVTDKAGIEHTKAVIEIAERAWDRYQGMLEFMLKLDLKRRVVELEEHQARLVGSAFMRIVLSPELGLKEAQIETARQMFADIMKELGGKMEPTWAVQFEEDIIDAQVVE